MGCEGPNCVDAEVTARCLAREVAPNGQAQTKGDAAQLSHYETFRSASWKSLASGVQSASGVPSWKIARHATGSIPHKHKR